MQSLPVNHFLSLQRPDVFVPAAAGTPDMSTLAAHDFDVDTRTGFMPPQPPIARLPTAWELWEATLDDAISSKLELADKPGLSQDDEERSARWRTSVRKLPILSTEAIKTSEILLRRAHCVLAWIMHFYVHTTPVSEMSIHIPAPVTVPLLQVCAQLQLPPVLTYSDDVLYNWAFKTAPAADGHFVPKDELYNLRCNTLFTGSRDEEEFYLSSARIELRGVEALSLMRVIMDEAFVNDAIAHRRITSYLTELAGVVRHCRQLLGAVRDGCDPSVFYNEIRPWFRGCDSDTRGRRWVFDGLELDPTLKEPTELSGPSAGQSSMIHALDIFLGVDRYSHSNFKADLAARSTPALAVKKSVGVLAPLPAPAPAPGPTPFLTRMQKYMPRHHRAFLRHLHANPRPLRHLVEAADDDALRAAYDEAVTALKEFRDEHVRIVALYIIIPARQAQGAAAPAEAGVPKGTGGTDAYQFVKGVRDQTAGAILGPKTA
ncbi:Indoleamine 2,3-dioxygenase [Epithele typhae]|uniref:Indoleamine 2,3-dioxygenase n=1 Tax=Epithele typhae TaxID=378194 RepID=UPI00200886EA|nr:Indoleamine 2,3-dioxygenase [Epithele typhae]KAH9914873.1 Indoleamine 2,3-dioxygenase [Epithele typhae]